MATVTLAREAMATRFEILLHGDNPAALRAAGEEALEEIDRLEAQLSLYRPSSEIAHLNARAGREWVRVSPTLFSLLEHAKKLWAETDGAFDPMAEFFHDVPPDVTAEARQSQTSLRFMSPPFFRRRG